MHLRIVKAQHDTVGIHAQNNIRRDIIILLVYC